MIGIHIPFIFPGSSTNADIGVPISNLVGALLEIFIRVILIYVSAVASDY